MAGIFAKIPSYGMDVIELTKSENTVYLPSNISALNGMEFEGYCEMECLYLPKSIKSVRWNGICRASFKRFIVEEGHDSLETIDGLLYSKLGFDRDSKRNSTKWKELIACPTLVNRVVVPNGVTKIANCCFKGSSVSEIVLPDGLIEIGDNSFYEAPYLKSIKIPTTINKIGGNKVCSSVEIEYGGFIFSGWHMLIEYLLANGFVSIPNTKTIIRSKIE